MKKYALIVLVFILSMANIFAQQEKGIVGSNNWLNNWTEFKPNQNDYGEPTQILAGNITETRTLFKREVYLLTGNVFVTNNSRLIIEPGTVILGDYKTKGSLTITKGSKIIAEGSETDPIVFSSNRSVKRPGDWGGIVLLGNAPINRYGSGSVASYYPKLHPSNYMHTNYGGADIEDDSGKLEYVRIEYAGKRATQESYFNGLLLASVGRETTFKNIMISFSGEDACEVWGGKVGLFNIIAYKSKGSDFKFNYGTRSVLSNSLAIRSPYSSGGNGAKSLELLSYTEKDELDFSKKRSYLKAKNLTFLNLSDNLNEDISKGLVNEAVYVGELSQLVMFKSVISGYNPAVVLDNNIRLNQSTLEKLKLTEMYFNNCQGNIFLENNPNNEDLENWYGNGAFYNVYSKSSNVETFIDIENLKRPDFRLRINKIIASNVDPDLMED